MTPKKPKNREEAKQFDFVDMGVKVKNPNAFFKERVKHINDFYVVTVDNSVNKEYTHSIT